VAIEPRPIYPLSAKGYYVAAVSLKRSKTALFDHIALEHIGLGVNELDNEDAEEIVVVEILGDENMKEAAEKFAQSAGLLRTLLPLETPTKH
jgi:hypothetical protein